jgi:4'-phosphopantetheinyl transferase
MRGGPVIPDGPQPPWPLDLPWATGVAGAKVWLLDLRREPTANAWAACQADEHARVARFKFDVHARRYRAAHAAMRGLMALQLGVAPEDWRWAAGVHGKPHTVVAGHVGPAHAPAAGHFNLSHSEDWALLAWHPHLPVGVDIEWRQPLPDVDSLAAQQFTLSEQAWVRAALPGDEREARFYRLWAAKEAALKALGSGLMVAPQRVGVALSGAPTPMSPPNVTQITLGPDDGRSMGGTCRLLWCELALPFAWPAHAALAWVAEGDAQLCW